MKLRVDERTPVEVEEFICWVLRKEPDKYQLYYCLAFINWKAKGDMKQAIRDFEAFLEACDEGVFPKEQELAREWVEEIRKELGGPTPEINGIQGATGQAS